MSYVFRTTPKEHQTNALKKGYHKPAFAYLMGTGTGKSKVIIDNICILYEQGLIDAALLIANKGSYRNLLAEIEIHMPERINRNVFLWDGSKSQTTLRKLHYLHTFSGLKIMVMNVEALSQIKGRGYQTADAFLSNTKALFAVDECTTIKNHSANRTKSVIELGQKAKYRRIMTGTPVTKSPLNLFSQFLFLDRGILGHKSYYSFRARYSVLKEVEFGGRKVQVPVAYRNLDELAEIIKPYSFRVVKEDCLDLPPKIYQRYEVEMTDAQKRMYEQFRDQALLELQDGTFASATIVITQMMRLHQIACGHITNEDGTIHDLSDARLNALMDVLDEMDGKVIIWCNYRYDIARVSERLRKEYGAESVVEYHGGIDPKVREENKIRFQEGNAQFFVANQQTGGYGLTLTAASNVVYYSNNYDLEQRLQSEDRVHRMGQSRSCVYVDMVCPGTVDEVILKALREKKNIADLITGDSYREWIK